MSWTERLGVINQNSILVAFTCSLKANPVNPPSKLTVSKQQARQACNQMALYIV